VFIDALEDEAVIEEEWSEGGKTDGVDVGELSDGLLSLWVELLDASNISVSPMYRQGTGCKERTSAMEYSKNAMLAFPTMIVVFLLFLFSRT
jgi:hypothetical protein